MIGATGEAKF